MRRFLPLLLAAGLLLAACGTSGGNDDAAPTTTTAATDDATTTTADDAATTTTDGPSGDDGDQPSEDNYVGAFTEQLSSGGGGNLSFDEDTATCVATGWVDALGVDALRESGVALDDLADPDFDLADELEPGAEAGAAMAQAFPACEADLIGTFADVVSGGDAEAAGCLVDAIDPEAFYEELGRSFGLGADEELSSMLDTAGTACGIGA
ncbi:MAG: hypothetical protein KDB04_05110 [Acidimicrobiales bacterium]|nr:hypothetical protein [Acidimicrobiales bacterium]